MINTASNLYRIKKSFWLVFLVLLTNLGLFYKIKRDFPYGIILSIFSLIILFKLCGLIMIKGMKIKNTPLGLPLFIFIMFGIFQMFNPNQLNLFIGLQGFKALFFPMLFFYVGTNLVMSNLEIYRIFLYIMWIGLITSIVGIIQMILVFLNIAVLSPIGNNRGTYILGNFLREDVKLAYGGPFFRITSTFSNYSSFAFFLSIFILISVGFYFIYHKKKYLLIACTGGVALLFTFLRIAYFSCFLGLIFLGYFSSKSSKKKRFLNICKVLFIFLLVLILLTLIGNNPVSRKVFSVFSISSTGSGIAAIAGRINMYKMYLEKFKDNSLIGIGLGTTVGISEKYSEKLKYGYVRADNDCINVLYQTGFFGMAMFIFIVLNILYFGNKIVNTIGKNCFPNLSPIIYSILINVIILGFAYNPLVEIPSNLLFWLFTGILMSYKYKIT